MRHLTLPLLAACLLAACAAPAGTPTPGASGSAVPGASTAPSPGASAGPGAEAPSTLTLVVDDKPYAVGPQTSVKPGDLLGKRISLDYEFGTEPATEAQARVTFRFGSPKSLFPTFAKADVNQGWISITYVDATAKAARTLYFEHQSANGTCSARDLAGVGGRIQGRLTCSAVKPQPGDVGSVKLDFTYDLAQPAFKP